MKGGEKEKIVLCLKKKYRTHQKALSFANDA